MKQIKYIGKIIQDCREVKMLNYSFYYLRIEFGHVIMLSFFFELKQCVIFA